MKKNKKIHYTIFECKSMYIVHVGKHRITGTEEKVLPVTLKHKVKIKFRLKKKAKQEGCLNIFSKPEFSN